MTFFARSRAWLPAHRLVSILGAWLLLAGSAAWTPSVVAPVADAAQRGDVQRVRSLIAARADVNAAHGDGMTALHWAADRGDVAITEVLLRARARIDLTTRIGAHTPLHVASRNGHGAVARALLRAGANPNALSSGGATPLHFAATSGSAATVTTLLDYQADANARELEWGQTPLMFAAAADRADAIAVLLKRGASAGALTHTVDLNEEGAREQAATRRRNEALLSYLPQKLQDSIRAAAARPAAAPPGGAPGALRGAVAQPATSAQTAAAAPATTVAPGQGTPPSSGQGTPAPRVSLDAPPTQGLTPSQIQAAIAEGRKSLLASGPRGPAQETADTADGVVAGYAGTVGRMGGLSALHHAARQGNMAAAIALLDGGADINLLSSSDSTSPLLQAALSGHFDLALRLVERGANVKLANTSNLGPLYAALNTQWAPRSRYPQPQAVQNQRTTHIELMTALIKAGADVNARLKKNLWFFAYNNCGNAQCGLENLEGTTSFWRAAYAVDVEAMRLLKANGADHTVPSFRAPVARGARGQRPGAALPSAPGVAVVGPDTATRARVAATAAQRGAAGGAAVGGASDGRAVAGGAAGGPPSGRGGIPGSFDPGPAAPLDPATDSAARAAAPGVGVFPIHTASGVGYGNGFAGNSHRHAPEGWMPALRYLVEELGADVNQRDVNGYTPVHHAAARGDNEMIQYLVSKGADVKAVARNGRTTVDMANGPVQRLRPFPETIALLEKLGAKNSHRCVSC